MAVTIIILHFLYLCLPYRTIKAITCRMRIYESLCDV
nr:MAG TPA: hypothetical protein [Caudoviricetes sp.]